MQAFDGIQVLDLTHVLAGPFATYQLAVLGADVIKIEAEQAFDMNREVGAVRAMNVDMMGTHFQSQAANKRAITLNLKTEEGREIFRELAATADVIVENSRTGKLDSLGLGYEDIRQIKPDIIYCSLTGFGQTGPKAGNAAFDNTIQAFSGMMLATGPEDDEAVLVGPPVLDYGSGAQAAFAISSALLRRERTGEGQRLDVAMLDAALMLMSSDVLNAHTTGRDPGRSRYARAPFAAYGGYRTSDGEVLMLGAASAAQNVRLWTCLGRADLADEVTALRTPDIVVRREREEPIVTEIIATKTAAEWEEVLIPAGLPAARVQTMTECLASEQVASRAVVGRYDSAYSKKGEMRPTVAAFMADQDGPEVHSPPPELGQHTQEVLAELGYTSDQIAAWREHKVI